MVPTPVRSPRDFPVSITLFKRSRYCCSPVIKEKKKEKIMTLTIVHRPGSQFFSIFCDNDDEMKKISDAAMFHEKVNKSCILLCGEIHHHVEYALTTKVVPAQKEQIDLSKRDVRIDICALIIFFQDHFSLNVAPCCEFTNNLVYQEKIDGRTGKSLVKIAILVGAKHEPIEPDNNKSIKERLENLGASKYYDESSDAAISEQIQLYDNIAIINDPAPPNPSLKGLNSIRSPSTVQLTKKQQRSKDNWFNRFFRTPNGGGRYKTRSKRSKFRAKARR